MTPAVAAIALAILAHTYSEQLKDGKLSEFGQLASLIIMWGCTIASILVLISI